jgi:glycosyltransferase involved in cell wall biosynthesis
METTVKRILFIGRFTGNGGAERHVISSARELQKAGYAADLLLLMHPTTFGVFKDFPGNVLSPTDNGLFSKVASYLRLWRLIGYADIVVCSSELTPTYISWFLCSLRKKPFVAEVQISLSSTIQQSALHKLLCCRIYPQIRFIRCVSHGVADDLIKSFGVPKSNTDVIYGPFDLEEIRRRAGEPLSSDDQKIFGRLTIVSAGRLERQKRFDLAIDAVAGLSKAFDVQLLILGDGEEREALQQRIKKLGIGERIHLLGFRENPYPYFARASLFLLSSDFEGLGRVIVEALALGCPVVSTDCPSGPREILGDNFGILVPVGDIDAVRKACERVLKEKDLAQTLRTQGNIRANDFAAAKTTDQLIRLLERAYSST